MAIENIKTKTSKKLEEQIMNAKLQQDILIVYERTIELTRHNQDIELFLSLINKTYSVYSNKVNHKYNNILNKIKKGLREL
ncbi:MAG: hypothetical protein PHD43_23350 [Methylococcales bacterium]|nr:hypothetical protein [Candidatus Paceibacterota bacterium]MDD5323485.1 hypothetical protein [Methylococcales bacterium]